MCELPDDVANSDVSDLKERTERYIDPALQYACMSWHMHLVDADMILARAPTITPVLHQFLEKKFLFWLEVLSVLGTVRNAVEALQVTADCLEVCRVLRLMSCRTYSGRIQESPTLDLANDCSRFVTGYFEVINTSAPHIYHSALVLTPQKSIVRKLYESYAQPFTRVVHGLPTSWDKNTAVTTRPSAIELAVWSPCSRFIAIICHDTTTVDVLDSVTLQRLQTLESPQDTSTWHRAVIFSPDSCILTCSSGGSVDHRHQCRELSVVSWDLQTGGVASIIKWKGPPRENLGNASIPYSANGKMVAVFHWDWDNCSVSTFIFGIVSGMHMHSHSFDDHTPLPDGIWTCGEFLRFATVRAGTITIWEVGFTSDATPTRVETLPVPDDHGYISGGLRLVPTPCRLALVSGRGVLIHDVRNSKHLLPCTDAGFNTRMSFSSDGRFFAWSSGSKFYLWKESPTGYILHEILESSTNRPNPLISPNGESIAVVGNHTIRLWRTKSSITTPSRIPAETLRRTEDFFLGFSPDGTLAVVARRGGNTVTILNINSGVLQLTINPGMGVDGLGVIGNTIVIIGLGKAVTWNLPAGDRVPDARIGLEGSSRMVNFSLRNPPMNGASISPDSRHVAVISGQPPDSLSIYCTSTGELLGETSIAGSTPKTTLWFSPDGCDVWCVRESGEARRVWRVSGGRQRWSAWSQSGVRLMLRGTPGDHLTVTRLRPIGGYLARIESNS